MCLSHLIYTVRPCLIDTCHVAPMPCSDHAVLLKATAQHGRLSTAVLCRGLDKNGMVRAWHGRGMASVNQTRPHCVNQMGKTHSKPLEARHGTGAAWARHTMCESAFKLSKIPVKPLSNTCCCNPLFCQGRSSRSGTVFQVMKTKLKSIHKMNCSQPLFYSCLF